MGRKTYRLFLVISLILINTTLIGTIQEIPLKGVNAFDVFEELHNLNNKDAGSISSLSEQTNTPLIRYLGPDNHPIEGFDLKSHSDELFEIDFRLDDNTPDEWVIRVYAYLDYNTQDTSLGDSEKFEDGSDFKQYQAGTPPVLNELNPDESFMGVQYNKILEDHVQWTTSENDYTAKKENLDLISDVIYFHVKVLYKIDFEGDDYYYYRTFYISNYWTSNFKFKPLNIYDDDTSPPSFISVDIQHPPIYDNNETIDFEIVVEDDTGIAELSIDFLGNLYIDEDKDNHIAIPNPAVPGEYSLDVIAKDADNDREGDQLSSTLYSSFKIFDDDVNCPILSEVCIINAPIYDSYDYIIFEILAEDESGIAEMFIAFIDSRYYNETVQIRVPNPRVPGIYDFTAVAVDNDSEYGQDQLNTTIASSFEIYDDDITPPQITIYENEDSFDLSIVDDDGITDSEATGTYTIISQYGQEIATGILDEEKIKYRLCKNIFYSGGVGTHTLLVQATNNDREWEGDEETSTLEEHIIITPDDYFKFLTKQIDDVKNYICNIVTPCVCDFLVCFFDTIQEYIKEAYDNFMADNILKTLDSLREARSKILVSMDLINGLYDIGCLSIEDRDFILASLHKIQDNFDNLIDYVNSM
ncbi:MAG: hypothetical protein ACXACC_03915 [Promethearchaeota archaeon]|jgi:hypothetical protein